jgi:hypothetical protein
MKTKPSYRTSEFWFTLVSFIFSGLFLLGVIGENDQKEELIRDISHGVESVILIAGQAAILYKYIHSRKELKQLPSEENKNEPEPKPQPEHQNDSAANKPRSNKRGSRKTSSKNKRRTKNSSKNSTS